MDSDTFRQLTFGKLFTLAFQGSNILFFFSLEFLLNEFRSCRRNSSDC